MEKTYRQFISLPDAATIIALASFYGYFFAYIYVSAYLKFFHIPGYYVDIGLTNVFSTIVNAMPALYIPFLALLFAYSTHFYKSYNSSEQPSTVTILIAPILLLLGEITIYGLSWKEYLEEIKLFSFIWALIIISFLVKKAMRRHRKNKKRNNNYVLQRDEAIFKVVSIALLFALHLIILKLVYEVGYSEALRQKWYHVISYNNRDFVIIRSYGDKVITVPFDARNKTFSNQFIFINSSELAAKNIPISFAEVGPLNPEK